MKNPALLPEGADVVQAAALVNPDMSSRWVARYRCQYFRASFSAIMLGAAFFVRNRHLQVAYLVAGKVIDSARIKEALESVSVG